jgi:hypothetical protein
MSGPNLERGERKEEEYWFNDNLSIKIQHVLFGEEEDTVRNPMTRREQILSHCMTAHAPLKHRSVSNPPNFFFNYCKRLIYPTTKKKTYLKNTKIPSKEA